MCVLSKLASVATVKMPFSHMMPIVVRACARCLAATLLLCTISTLCAADSETVYLGLGVVAVPAPAENPPENSSALLEGSGDFDGDGRFGADEDTDGDDVFHTIATIPGFKVDEGTGGFVVPALRYNSLTIVSSGVFREFLRPAHFGSTTIEAAAGVRAIFDAEGMDTEATTRKLNPCLTVHGPMTLRNLLRPPTDSPTHSLTPRSRPLSSAQ